ncbi:MAG TPA: Fur family transcriptional regulator [Anaerolineaceae bacterium]|nr:Fur family transcriptional regulator [Anaerolineaceae bacterium]
MKTFETLTASLQKADLRLTPQRIAICRLLSETEEHPTAGEIFAQVRAQYPSLSLMTVYNTLKALVELGAVNALGAAGDDNVHYDADMRPHVNLACIACHRIVDLPSRHVAELDREISQISGYQLLGARVLYYGLCPDCQKTVPA